MRTFLIPLAAFLCLLSHSAARAAEAPKPNVVFFLIDDMGRADCGFMGGTQIRTPNIDKLAKAGSVLDQFYVQPVCSPTRAALMTGRYPLRYGLQVSVIRPWAQYGLPVEERLLPQALKEVGYRTGVFGKWHLGHCRPEFQPTQRGFDRQYGCYNGSIDCFTHIREGGHDWHRDDKASHDEGYSSFLIADEAAKFVKDGDGKQPFFLYVPFNAVHGPLQSPAEYDSQYADLEGKRRDYAKMLTATDDAIGRIVAAIDERGLRKNTLFFFSSDNGGPNPGGTTENGPLRAGKGTVYEGGVRVAAFATWEGVIPAGGKVSAPLHIVDIYPTVLKLAGASLEQKLPLDGRDAWPAIAQGAPSPHDVIVNNINADGGAIRVGDWKIVVNGNKINESETGAGTKKKKKGKGTPGLVELFNLADDPNEKNDLAGTQPEKLRELRQKYDELAAKAAEPLISGAMPKDFSVPKVWGER